MPPRRPGTHALIAAGALSVVNGAVHLVLPLTYPPGGWAHYVDDLHEPIRWALYATTVFFGVLLMLAGGMTVALARAVDTPVRVLRWVVGGMAGFWLVAATYGLVWPFPVPEARWAIPLFSLTVAGLYLLGLWLGASGSQPQRRPP